MLWPFQTLICAGIDSLCLMWLEEPVWQGGVCTIVHSVLYMFRAGPNLIAKDSSLADWKHRRPKHFLKPYSCVKMIFSPQAPDPANSGQYGHRFSQRASSSAALVTQTRQSGEWYIQFNTLAALLIARQLPTYKTNEAKITNQFGIDSAPATMTHRLFLGPSNQFSRLSQKTNQSVSGPNDQF